MPQTNIILECYNNELFSHTFDDKTTLTHMLTIFDDIETSKVKDAIDDGYEYEPQHFSAFLGLPADEGIGPKDTHGESLVRIKYHVPGIMQPTLHYNTCKIASHTHSFDSIQIKDLYSILGINNNNNNNTTSSPSHYIRLKLTHTYTTDHISRDTQEKAISNVLERFDQFNHENKIVDGKAIPLYNTTTTTTNNKDNDDDINNTPSDTPQDRINKYHKQCLLLSRVEQTMKPQEPRIILQSTIAKPPQIIIMNKDDKQKQQPNKSSSSSTTTTTIATDDDDSDDDADNDDDDDDDDTDNDEEEKKNDITSPIQPLNDNDKINKQRKTNSSSSSDDDDEVPDYEIDDTNDDAFYKHNKEDYRVIYALYRQHRHDAKKEALKEEIKQKQQEQQQLNGIDNSTTTTTLPLIHDDDILSSDEEPDETTSTQEQRDMLEYKKLLKIKQCGGMTLQEIARLKILETRITSNDNNKNKNGTTPTTTTMAAMPTSSTSTSQQQQPQKKQPNRAFYGTSGKMLPALVLYKICLPPLTFQLPSSPSPSSSPSSSSSYHQHVIITPSFEIEIPSTTTIYSLYNTIYNLFDKNLYNNLKQYKEKQQEKQKQGEEKSPESSSTTTTTTPSTPSTTTTSFPFNIHHSLPPYKPLTTDTIKDGLLNTYTKIHTSHYTEHHPGQLYPQSLRAKITSSITLPIDSLLEDVQIRQLPNMYHRTAFNIRYIDPIWSEYLLPYLTSIVQDTTTTTTTTDNTTTDNTTSSNSSTNVDDTTQYINTIKSIIQSTLFNINSQ